MNERNPSSGAMTGATGALTPDDLPEPFIPAERREVSDAETQAAVTAAQGRRAPIQAGEIGEPRSDRSDAGPTATTPTSRESSSASATDGDTRIGGDAVSDGGEHF